MSRPVNERATQVGAGRMTDDHQGLVDSYLNLLELRERLRIAECGRAIIPPLEFTRRDSRHA